MNMTGQLAHDTILVRKLLRTTDAIVLLEKKVTRLNYANRGIYMQHAHNVKTFPYYNKTM